MENKYSKMSEELLSEAEEEIKGGNYLQASEKLWGAAAHAMKAIAEKRGWEHDGHGKLFNIVDRLVKETGDNEIRTLFSFAGMLHTNFYENWLSADYIIASVNEIKRLVEKLNQL